MPERLKVALLMLCSILGCVLLVDLVLLILQGPVRMVENFYTPDPRFGYRMLPQQEFVFANPYHGYHATVRTNSRGLRDAEITLPKPAGEFRVLLLGDSMTAGFEVEKNETFESVCEEILAASGPVQVINAGVRGYNLDNILGFLESEGLSYQPDVVVYLFVENDLTAEPTYQPAHSDLSRGFTMRGLVGRLSVYSHLSHRLEILRQRWTLRRQRDAIEQEKTRVSIPSGVYEILRNPAFEMQHYVLTEERIGNLAALCRASGAEFVLVGAPHREEIDPVTQDWWNRTLAAPGRSFDFDAIRNFMAHVATRYDLPRLDPVPAFRQDARTRDYWFHKDNHLNREGHRLLGRQLAGCIQGLSSFRTWRERRASSP